MSDIKMHAKTFGVYLVIIFILAAACAAVGWYLYNTSKDLTETRMSLAALTDQKSKADIRIVELEGSLLAANKKTEEISGVLTGNIKDLTKTVGDLEKLSKTDPQLLEKYSKVYFLNEHYVPERLTPIDPSYVYDNRKTEQIHADVWPHLQAMLNAAKTQGIELRVASAYRSFAQQVSVKENHKVMFGSGANKFSADQGFSEHQLGTAVDLLMANSSDPFAHFDGTSGFQWLVDNAHEYGFVLSYPKNNAYYEFEPWHWRYVGRSLAAELHAKGQYFYDMDQRDINAHLIDLFD